MKALEKIQKLQQEMGQIVVEREDQIEGSLAALISGVHVLLLGPPGTAKSLLANKICESLDKAEFFSWLLTKFSTPEEIFGPYSVKGLKEDKYRRVVAGKLPTAHIAFLDEIFKANSAILNSLLTLINERKFHNDGGSQDVPLLSCFGASNELPAGEELGALYDRFVLRYWVGYIEDDQKFMSLLDGSIGNDDPETTLTLDEISELQGALEEINVPRELLETIRGIQGELKIKGVIASDRRWKTAVKVLQAFALLRGLDEVSNDELEALADMLWDKPEDRKVILEVVSPYANPLNLMAIEFEDAAKEAFSTWEKELAQDGVDEMMVSIRANNIFKEILAKVKAECTDRPDNKTRKLRASGEKIENWKNQVMSKLV